MGQTEARYRVTLIDNATSNRTVLANVTLGRAYNVGGVTVRIDPERNEAIGVIGSETERKGDSLPKGANSGEYR